MTRARFSTGLSFRAKMLVAVTIVMSLLVAVSLWLVSQRFKQQIHNNAADQLRTAEGVLKIRQQTRSAELFLRFNVANNEPKFKAAAALLSDQDRRTPEGIATIRQTLQQMIKAIDADVIVLTPAGGGRDIPESRDPQFNSQAFGGQCAGLIRQALNGQAQGGMIAAGDRLFDVVSLPIRLSGDGDVVGSITFGVANSMASEFKQSMSKDDDLVLLLDNKVVSSTLGQADPAVPGEFARIAAASGTGGGMQEIVLGNEHFWGLAGWLGSEQDSSRLGYLILSSWEKPLQELYSIEQSVLLIGLAAMISGIAVVWLLVHKITEPLRDLQESAAAVGRGDFSRRVDIRTNDEFGKLGRAFNEMTRDIERSHSELQQTVNTLKTTQAQLVQSEKLSAVGEFVAGVAHELNNPLAAVIGFSEMLKEDADVGPENRQHLDLIFKSSLRCRKIVQSLLSFARRHQPERKPVSVNKLVEEVLEIVAYQLRTSNVKVFTRLCANLPLVLADGHQIQQVILNLINNARQAIEAHKASGCITIASELHDTVVRVAIQDDGPGIAPENLSRIFDPFFTTKEVGKGTGLGLSLCYGLIHEHGGNISVVCQPGSGATFTIELPVTDGAVSADIPAVADHEFAKSNEGAGKTVLLVDDEEILLEMIQNGLKRHGYEIIKANTGEAALQMLHKQAIDAICMDIKMPGMNGRQLYDWIRNTRPATARRVIFMTGDVINKPLQLFLEQEQLTCLHKPFAIADLRKSIREVLKENKGEQSGPRE